MRTLISAANPVWVNEEHTSIILIAEFAELPHLQKVIFAAKIDDSEEYGREIFTRAQKGEFGVIAPYINGRENAAKLMQIKGVAKVKGVAKS